ncbi:MAG: hypothetical protein WCG06_02730, partial [Candidatus Omnitrophota bacterium]
LEAAKNPAQIHLVTANFTGSLRLFVGLGWPMVYFVAVIFGRRKQGKKGFWAIELEDEHSISVLSLLPALAYFLVIYFKGTLTMFDGVVLAAIYFVYLWLLAKMPPQEQEGVEDLGRIPRSVMGWKKPYNVVGIIGFFLAGGLILWLVAHPFLQSMLACAMAVGVSQFVFVQWVAPFLSEFPEKLSAFHWARQVTKAPMALTNFVSSSINQWTILVAMIPYIYSYGVGHAAFIPFDQHQKAEILLTIVQSYLGFVFLASMDFAVFEATALFVLWLAQFLLPGIRGQITWVYGTWALIETVRLVRRPDRRNAFTAFAKLCRTHLSQNRNSTGRHQPPQHNG